MGTRRLGVMGMHGLSTTHVKRSSDRETLMIIEVIVCAAGWIALMATLAGIQKADPSP